MQKIKDHISKIFKIKNLGSISQLLGLVINYDHEAGILQLSNHLHPTVT